MSVHQVAKQAAAERRQQRLRAFNSRIQKEQEKAAKIEKLLSAFISTFCSAGPDFKVSTEEFRHAFNMFANDKTLTCYDLVPIMKARGYIKKRIRVDGNNVQGYVGICLKS